jgi:hypothetical protein
VALALSVAAVLGAAVVATAATVEGVTCLPE